MQKRYFGRFGLAWDHLAGAHWHDQPRSIDGLEMVHPTISDGSTLRVWYLPRSSGAAEPGRPLIEWRAAGGADWQRVPDERVSTGLAGGGGHAARVAEMGVDVFSGALDLQLRVSGGGLQRTHELDVRLPPEVGAREPFSFLVSSCFLPWQTGRDGRLFIEKTSRNVLAHLAQRAGAPVKTRPALHLQLGDQIYTDGGADRPGDKRAAAYLRGQQSTDVQGPESGVAAAFDSMYRYNFGLKPLDQAMSAIPSSMMIDDHEVRDGWGARAEGEEGWQSFYTAGLDAFQAFQASRNPGRRGSSRTGFDHSFDWGAAHFFALDTRSRADCKQLRDKVCGEQLARLVAWLDRVADLGRGKPALLVVSMSVPLTPIETGLSTLVGGTSLAIADDANDRFTKEESMALQKRFAEHLAEHPKHTLLVLSGDVHYSSARVLELGGAVRGYEIVSSGLAQQSFNSFVPLISTQTVDGPFKVTARGFLPLPSFAEVFVAYPEGSAPEIKILYYPGEQLRDESVLWDGVVASPVAAESGEVTEAAPPVAMAPGALLPRLSRPLDLARSIGDGSKLAGCAVKPEDLPISGTGELGKGLSKLHARLNEIWGVPFPWSDNAVAARSVGCEPVRR